MLAAGNDCRWRQCAAGERFVVHCREPPASFDIRAEAAELGRQDGRLNGVEPAVESAQNVLEAVSLAVVAEQARTLGELG